MFGFFIEGSKTSVPGKHVSCGFGDLFLKPDSPEQREIF
jgi:hypothetical protein